MNRITFGLIFLIVGGLGLFLTWNKLRMKSFNDQNSYMQRLFLFAFMIMLLGIYALATDGPK